MSITAIILVFISAAMHAGWNLLSKSRRPSAAFFLLTSTTGFLVLSPLLIAHYEFIVTRIPLRVWGLTAGAGWFMALYYIGLAGAYRAGDMSVAYPLARSSPVIVVTVVAVLLGRGDEITLGCFVGILLVVGGCFLVPMRRFREIHLRSYLNATCGLALLAAVGTTGYSILDDESLRILRNVPDSELGTTTVSLIYAGMEAFATMIWLGLFVGIRRRGRAVLGDVLRDDLRHAIVAGIAIHATYGLVLISMAFVRNVSYVVAFRQLSIPLGAVIAIVALGEPPYRPKLLGTIIMLLGLLLVATQ